MRGVTSDNLDTVEAFRIYVQLMYVPTAVVRFSSHQEEWI